MIASAPTVETKTLLVSLETTERSFAQLIEALSSAVGSHAYPAGVELFHQGEAAREIFFLEAGLAKLVSSEENGRELIVDIRFAGALLGLSAAINTLPHPLTATTVSNCRLRRISAKDFADLLNQNANLGSLVHRVLSDEVITQAARIAEIACLSARQRLENFIWRITRQTSSLEQQHSKLRLPLKQWEVAQFLAITPAYLCRLLAELESEEIIVRRNGWIIVCTIGGLWHRSN